MSYSIALFIHLASVVALVAGAAIVRVALSQLRGARRIEQVTAWARTLGVLRFVFPIGSLVLLLAGADMVGQRFPWTSGWVLVAVLALIAINLIGATAGAASLEAIAMALGGREEGPVPPQARAALRAPRLWSAIHVNLGLVLSVMWVMVTKPAGVIAALIVLAGAAAGWSVARLTPARESAARESAARESATIEVTTALEPMMGAEPKVALDPAAAAAPDRSVTS